MLRSIKSILVMAVASTVFYGTAYAQVAVPPLLPPGQQAPSPSGAAQIPAQPAGGMDTPPTVGNEDPAMRMNLSGGSTYVETMQGTAENRLQGLMGTSVSSATGSELEEMMRIRRSNLLLNLKKEEAELAVGLWGALFNNEHVKAWRERESSEQQRIRDEQKELAASLNNSSNSSASAAVRSMPVVFEITNGVATILVPGSGEVTARSGTTLPNGMKVESVGTSVVVEENGERFPLGMGTKAGGTSPAIGTIDPGLAQPLPIY